MLVLIVGLVIFLGVHSTRIVADGWRGAMVARLGEGPWKGLYSLASAVGFVLIIWGYALARATQVDLWSPPAWTRTAAGLLMLVSFVLVAAAYVPRNRIKAKLGHPMLVGTKVWALAHLLANGRAADIVLFGAFLVWAVVAFRSARLRDRAAGTAYPHGTLARDATAAAIGLGVWVLFGGILHTWLIGVPIFG
jgi:uncharacterized membrane protein